MKKKLNVIIDRPLGYEHPEWPGFIYRVNYGYVPGIMAPDGEEQDVFVLGVNTPLQEFEGDLTFTQQEIEEAVAFSEQYFDSYIEMV